jgi:hypothetical protein
VAHRKVLFALAACAPAVTIALACNLSATADVAITGDIDVDAGSADAEPLDAYPAAHASLPTILSAGGPILASPVFVPILFQDDPFQSDIITFNSTIGASSYWGAVVGPYGVDAAVGGAAVVLAPNQGPPGIGGTVTDYVIQQWLATATLSGVLAGSNSANTVYSLYFPAGTTVTYAPLLNTLTSCVDFAGYHSQLTPADAGESVTYVVVPRCDTSSPLAANAISGIGAITGPASHEYVEAVVDPGDGTYDELDAKDVVWELTLGGEPADLCLYAPAPYLRLSDFGYTVQRIWSNAASANGTDPCIPSPATAAAYFGSVGELPPIQFASSNAIVNTTGLLLPVGGSGTVAIDLFSSKPTSFRWNVKPVETSPLTGGPSNLSFAWEGIDGSVATGQNGDKLRLQVTLKAAPFLRYDGFLIVSGAATDDEAGVTGSSWLGLVFFQPESNADE